MMWIGKDKIESLWIGNRKVQSLWQIVGGKAVKIYEAISHCLSGGWWQRGFGWQRGTGWGEKR